MLSSLVGTLSLCLEYVKDPVQKSYALLVVASIGGINALIGSVQLYLDRGKLSGQHAAASQAWNSLAGKIEIVLSKPLSARPECSHLLDQIQSDHARLIESSPDIPSSIVAQFKKENKSWIEENRSVSYYLNGLHKLQVFSDSENGNVDDGANDEDSIRRQNSTSLDQLPELTSRVPLEIELQKQAVQL